MTRVVPEPGSSTLCDEVVDPFRIVGLVHVPWTRTNKAPKSDSERWGGRVVYCTGFENRRGVTAPVGSNPTPTANSIGIDHPLVHTISHHLFHTPSLPLPGGIAFRTQKEAT